MNIQYTFSFVFPWSAQLYGHALKVMGERAMVKHIHKLAGKYAVAFAWGFHLSQLHSWMKLTQFYIQHALLFAEANLLFSVNIIYSAALQV